MTVLQRKRLLAVATLALGLALAAPGLANPATCRPSWGSIPGSVVGLHGIFAADASSLSDVWAVSGYGATSSSVVAHFDGTSWNLVAAPADKHRYAVKVVGASDVWTIAQPIHSGPWTIEHFDGTSWSSLPVPGALLRDLAVVSASDVWAVGLAFAGTALPPIVHWDGTSLRVVPSVSPTELGATRIDLDSIAAIGPNDIWVVGTASYSDHGSTLIEHWDGRSWQLVPSPNPDRYAGLGGVTALAPNDVWAVGHSGDSVTRPLIEHWDGTSWSVVPSPDPGPGPWLPAGWLPVTQLYGISAVSADDIWAVGHDSLIEHWDGTSWSVDPVRTRAPVLLGVSALSDGTVFAVSTNALYQLCEVSVGDDAVLPASVTGVAPGNMVAWHVDSKATQAHGVVDASRMGLFDSGLRAPGSSFTYTFSAAGSYPIVDEATGHKSMVKVSMAAAPLSGTRTTAFTLTWAPGSASSGYAYDVQVRRPGAAAYVDFAMGTAGSGATFTPDAGSGAYAFRARIRNTGNDASSGWSSAKTITVS
jgi:plastocyanin